MLKWSHDSFIPEHGWRAGVWIMIFPLSIDSPHLSPCQALTIDPAPVHTPAHTTHTYYHLSVISVYCEFLCDSSWQTRETAHVRQFIPPSNEPTQTLGGTEVWRTIVDHTKTLTMRWLWTLSHLWLLRDARETLRALSHCLEPGDAELFWKID